MTQAVYELENPDGVVVLSFAAATDGNMTEHISRQAEPKGMKVVDTGVLLSNWGDVLKHIKSQPDV